MEPVEQANAYQQFFYKSEAGKLFMEALYSLENRHISRAQKDKDLNELSMSAGNKEVVTHIETVIAQVARQLQE